MDAKLKTQLELAKAYTYQLRLQEAYALFRRYFDRLPFQPEKEHAEYIGVFVRVLLELGKERELSFYGSELERLYEKNNDPWSGYQLAVVYFVGPTEKYRAAREIFLAILKSEADELLKIKSKVCLIWLHQFHGEIPPARAILDTIPVEIADTSLDLIVKIWRSVIAREEGKHDEAEDWIQLVRKKSVFDDDWYVYLSMRIEEIKIALAKKRMNEAGRMIREIRKLLKKKRCRSMTGQVEYLERNFLNREHFGVLKLKILDDENIVSYGNRSARLKGNSAAERLLLLMLKRRNLNHGQIIQELYDREYNSVSDDKRIHYQIHSVRKILSLVGLPTEAIRHHSEGYRLLALVETTKEVL